MDWLDLALSALNAIPNWLPVVTSFVATVIAVLAYFRSAPPILPKAWIEVEVSRPAGAKLLLHVENRTSWPIQLHDLRVDNEAIELSEPIVHVSHQEWGRSVKLDAAISPNGSFEFTFVMRRPDSISCTTPSLHLSISTMRRVVRQRTIVIPTIVPKHTDASTK